MTGVILTAMCLAGIALWRKLERGGLHPLREDDTTHHGLALFLAMMLLANVAALAAQASAGGKEGLADASLQDLLSIQALTQVLAIVAVMAVASRFGVTARSVGLRRHEGPSAAGLAVAGWLTCYPFLVLMLMLNQAMVPPDSEALQDNLKRFMTEEGAASDPIVWLCIVVALPIAEEIMFRGALYGGLRRLMPRGAAMVFVGVLFGLLHDGPTLLPVATLGIALAYVYERTGSLLAPCILHSVHNGITLALTVSAAHIPPEYG